jgi:hypothetical protein
MNIEHDAIELAKLTPASGWGDLPDPETVRMTFTKAELEVHIRRVYRQLAEGRCARQPDETHQQCADRIGAMGGHPLTMLHNMRVSYLNLEALS